MELVLDENGNPVSAAIVALGGRRLDLSTGQEGPHPLQALSVRWRSLSSSLLNVVTELESLSVVKPDGSAAVEAFRKLTYDATELFDAYTNLLVSRLTPFAPRRDLKEYSTAAKRWRDPWALMCNRFKHDSAQIVFVSGKSKVNGLTFLGFMVLAYRNGDALIRDVAVHKEGQEAFSLARTCAEILHGLFRVDLLAAKLIRATPDTDATQLSVVPGGIALAQTLQRLMALNFNVFGKSAIPFNSFELGTSLSLCRQNSRRLPDPAQITTTVRGDGVTRTFSFA